MEPRKKRILLRAMSIGEFSNLISHKDIIPSSGTARSRSKGNFVSFYDNMEDLIKLSENEPEEADIICEFRLDPTTEKKIRDSFAYSIYNGRNMPYAVRQLTMSKYNDFDMVLTDAAPILKQGVGERLKKNPDVCYRLSKYKKPNDLGKQHQAVQTRVKSEMDYLSARL